MESETETPAREAEADARGRGRYHHGDLKTALVEAATRIVCEKRIEGFSVADAARAVGVSSGAPYRHFADRDDLLDHVAAAGFLALHEDNARAWARHPPGSIEGLVEAGLSYIGFGAARPELFHLMWGATRPETAEGVAASTGTSCYGEFLANLAVVMRAQGLGHLDPAEFAQPLWAMVHGYATLLIGRSPKLAASTVEDLRPRIERAARAYFFGVKAAEGV